MLFKGPFPQKNIGDDIFVDQKCVPHGTYVMFPTADIHDNQVVSIGSQMNSTLRTSLLMQFTRLGGTPPVVVCPGKRAKQITMKIIVRVEEFQSSSQIRCLGCVRLMEL
ncbi:hypothetical protein BDR07DRAFT_1413173 [Suillus spraguei]|nr:hypothetical protein BDR07DRAFT_1413173 [Suillus spraguei]